MTEKYKILAKFIKDMSSETKDIETYLNVKENLNNYKLGIDIYSKALKDKIIEINTNLRFENNQELKKKSHFELTYTTIIKIDENIKEKEELEKILLCDLQIKIYPDLEKSLLNLLHNSGYPEVKLDKKIDFEGLYNNKKN
jgi:preprotein translocase subunit SecB